MIVLDVNVLVAAFRADHEFHDHARGWLMDALRRGVPIAVPDLVWVGFVRICANPRVFSVASTIAEATAFARALAAQRSYVHLGGLRDDIEPFFAEVEDASAAANLATDAYIAAVALEWAAEVATFDRDFRRFDGLRIVQPSLARTAAPEASADEGVGPRIGDVAWSRDELHER